MERDFYGTHPCEVGGCQQLTSLYAQEDGTYLLRHGEEAELVITDPVVELRAGPEYVGQVARWYAEIH